MSASPVRISFDQNTLPSRSMTTAPFTRSNEGSSASSGPIAQARNFERRDQIVLLLQNVVGELVARGKAQAARLTRGIDDVNAGDFGLFAAVIGERRRSSGSPWARKSCPVPL